MDFFNHYADVRNIVIDWVVEVEENKIIDSTEIKNEFWDYYGLLNVTRFISNDENDALSDTDLQPQT